MNQQTNNVIVLALLCASFLGGVYTHKYLFEREYPPSEYMVYKIDALNQIVQDVCPQRPIVPMTNQTFKIAGAIR